MGKAFPPHPTPPHPRCFFCKHCFNTWSKTNHLFTFCILGILPPGGCKETWLYCKLQYFLPLYCSILTTTVLSLKWAKKKNHFNNHQKQLNLWNKINFYNIHKNDPDFVGANATVSGVTKSWSWLSDWTETTKFIKLGGLLRIQIYMYKITINVQYKSLQIYIERMFMLFSPVQSLSHVWLPATPWIAARQASLSITNSWSLLKLMPIKSVMPSSVVPFSSCPQSLPASGSFPMSQLFEWGGLSIGVSASALVLPMNTQDWSPLGWTDWISLQSKGLSRVFSNTTVQKHQFFSTQLSSQSNSHIDTWPLEKP